MLSLFQQKYDFDKTNKTEIKLASHRSGLILITVKAVCFIVRLGKTPVCVVDFLKFGRRTGIIKIFVRVPEVGFRRVSAF